MISIFISSKHGEFEFWIDDEDQDLSCISWSVHGVQDTWYASRTKPRTEPKKFGGTEHLHTAILERKLGRTLQKGETADHKNRDTLDCRRENIRLAVGNQNHVNSIHFNPGPYPNGLRVRSGGFAYCMRVNGKQVYSEVYSTVEEASIAYRQTHVEINGEFSPYYVEGVE